MWYVAAVSFIGGVLFGVFLSCLMYVRKEDKSDE